VQQHRYSRWCSAQYSVTRRKVVNWKHGVDFAPYCGVEARLLLFAISPVRWRPVVSSKRLPCTACRLCLTGNTLGLLPQLRSSRHACHALLVAFSRATRRRPQLFHLLTYCSTLSHADQTCNHYPLPLADGLIEWLAHQTGHKHHMHQGGSPQVILSRSKARAALEHNPLCTFCLSVFLGTM
jgi:hypothetical protein